MIVNFEKRAYLRGSDSNQEKRKIYLRDPNMVDASTSHLRIPNTIEMPLPKQEDTAKHLGNSLLIGIATVPFLLMGGYLGAVRGAEKKFFVDAALKSRSHFRPIIKELEGKISKVTIKTEDKIDLKCWDINPHGFEKYVLVCHGNSQNLNECQEIYSEIHKKGYGVMALEYRGYAKNPGTITEAGLYKDGEAAIKYLRDKGIKDKKIGLFGYSLGGAVATDLASKNDFGFVVLMSTFTNAKELSKNAVNYLDLNLPKFVKKGVDSFPDMLIPLGNSYESDKKISKIKCPITFIHSRDDSAIPISVAKKLSDKATGTSQKRFITLSSGNHWFDDSKFAAISDAIEKFSL